MVRPAADRFRKHIQVRSHEEGLARSVAIVPVVSIDHSSERRETGGHGINNEIADLRVDLASIARACSDCAHDALRSGAHERLGCRGFLLQ